VVGLASHGARVYIGARNEQKATKAIEEIKNELPDADVRYVNLDLSNLQNVVSAAKFLKK
jgi:NAD(P)-dependent dehydrogenase (short-subunit alcohol dehydrogenase family)